MSKLVYSILVIFAITFISCEEQMIPLPDGPVIGQGRVMLIEDMTGVNCPPCHGAITLLESNLETYKGSIVIYGVHGKVQSDPIEDSKYDFRYPDAAALEANFAIVGKPSASFNRREFAGGSRVRSNFPTWQPFIDAELEKAQVVEIKMLSTYNSETRTADIDFSVIPLEDFSGTLDLHVVITESHLIDPQKTQSLETPVIKDFEHNHVMKASLTGLAGNPVGTDVSANAILKESLQYQLPAEVNGEWIAENMEIIAFVTSTAHNNEIQQAAQIKMVE